MTRAVVFVAVLPYSGVVFARAYADMKSPAWLDAHIRAFGYFGGVPQIVVPDNPTTAIIRPVRGDAAGRSTPLSAARRSLRGRDRADQGAPSRDKAAVENAVNVIGTRVLGYLEAQQWTSLAELNTAIDSGSTRSTMTWSALMTRLAGAGSPPRNRHCWDRCPTRISRRSSGGHSKPSATTTSPLTGGITRSRTGWPARCCGCGSPPVSHRFRR